MKIHEQRPDGSVRLAATPEEVAAVQADPASLGVVRAIQDALLDGDLDPAEYAYSGEVFAQTGPGSEATSGVIVRKIAPPS